MKEVFRIRFNSNGVEEIVNTGYKKIWIRANSNTKQVIKYFKSGLPKQNGR